MQEKILLDRIGKSDIAMKSLSTIENANFAVKNKDFVKAVELYQNAVEETTETSDKVTYLLQIAKIYYSELNDKAQAKQFLLKLLELDANNGKAYILLGNMYYAAQKECFPTDSFAQKMAISAAIQKWKKAKSVDPSVADQANEYINKYRNYTPTESELFIRRGTFNGKYYHVGCWIDEKIRVK